MLNKIILASKSKIRKEILDKNNIISEVEASNIDEDIVKKSLLKEGATPEIVSKNLAELKANIKTKIRNTIDDSEYEGSQQIYVSKQLPTRFTGDYKNDKYQIIGKSY